MSKKLERRATKLVRKAEVRAIAIRRAVREYREVQTFHDDPVRELERQIEIERAVLKYNQVNKVLKRVQKKIQVKVRVARGHRITRPAR